MPIYEYECDDGHKFELTLPFSEMHEPVWCPVRECGIGDDVRCGSPARRRVVPSSPAVAIFKGSGFTRSSNLGKAR